MVLSAVRMASLLRAGDDKFVSGAGAILCFVAGLLLAMTTRGALREFYRTEVFIEVGAPAQPPAKAAG